MGVLWEVWTRHRQVEEIMRWKRLDWLCLEQLFCISCTHLHHGKHTKKSIWCRMMKIVITDISGKLVIFFNQLCFCRFLLQVFRLFNQKWKKTQTSYTIFLFKYLMLGCENLQLIYVQFKKRKKKELNSWCVFIWERLAPL